jgi:hypothetical protein
MYPIFPEFQLASKRSEVEVFCMFVSSYSDRGEDEKQEQQDHWNAILILETQGPCDVLGYSCPVV